MSKTWQLQEAKNKFSRVVDDAVNSGPQIITRHGVEVAIVISYASHGLDCCDCFAGRTCAGHT